ncbi:MAG TPA: aminopeptidase [Methanomicrobia archaeon]|nr:aminopeptidase [Methanomicrobia archaeon]
MKGDYLEKLATVMVNYSADVKEGMKVLIAGPTEAEPAMLEIYKEALKAGAHPILYPQSHHAREIFFEYASNKQLDQKDVSIDYLFRNVDRSIQFFAETNTKAFTRIDPSKLTRNQRAYTDTIQAIQEREKKGEYKWALTAYPTDAQAQESSMSLLQYQDFVYNACLFKEDDPIQAWEKISAQQEKICEWLNERDEIRYVGLDTDITFATGGRRWVNCDGHKNFPDGEVFTSPLEDSANGTIRFTYPLIYMGNEIEDVRITFKEGEVVKATAAKGQKLLEEVIAIDEGSRMIGELAIGTNYGVKEFIKHMLFDEKMGGTVHLALGMSPDPTVGNNESTIHLDILKDMKDGGKIYADGELFYENGTFLI